MAWTRVDGWVWVFACVDHYPAEAWTHVAKVGDRFAALQPVDDAVTTASVAWLGIGDDPAFLGEPETNRCAERWIGTLKSSACGSSATTPWRSSARPWPGSSTATTPRG